MTAKSLFKMTSRGQVWYSTSFVPPNRLTNAVLARGSASSPITRAMDVRSSVGIVTEKPYDPAKHDWIFKESKI